MLNIIPTVSLKQGQTLRPRKRHFSGSIAAPAPGIHQDSLTVNPDGTHTIDLNKIPELRELFKKNVVNIKYWDMIAMDKLSFEKGLITLRLSHKLTNIVRTAIGIIEVLPKGRFIRPLLNRF